MTCQIPVPAGTAAFVVPVTLASNSIGPPRVAVGDRAVTEIEVGLTGSTGVVGGETELELAAL